MEHNTLIYLLFIAMPIVAFLYASVGHGGASSYIALLTLFGFLPEQVRPTALVLNCIVSGIAFFHFRKSCVFLWPLFLSLAAFSIPASYLGGTINIDAALYKKIVAIVLLFPIFRLLKIVPSQLSFNVERTFWMAPVIGLCIGFISGLIGIGGGIILSPLLLLLGWTNFKQTAAISSLFIFVNSVAGLFGAKFQIQILDIN